MTMRKVKPESYSEMGMTSPSKNETFLPTVNFDNKTLPEAKDWKVGKMYEVGLRLRMRGISNRKGSDGKEYGNYDFEIVGIDPDDGDVKESGKRYTE